MPRIRNIIQRMKNRKPVSAGERRTVVYLMAITIASAVSVLLHGLLPIGFYKNEAEPPKEQLLNLPEPEPEKPPEPIENLPVDINSADQKQLETLPYIGPVLAKRIIQWRNEHGLFESIDHLDAVDGIGPARIHQLRSKAAAIPPNRPAETDEAAAPHTGGPSPAARPESPSGETGPPAPDRADPEAPPPR